MSTTITCQIGSLAYEVQLDPSDNILSVNRISSYGTREPLEPMYLSPFIRTHIDERIIQHRRRLVAQQHRR